MRHYVVVFLESRLFPGTWIADHFVRGTVREDVPQLPDGLKELSHSDAMKNLTEWQNLPKPDPVWTLDECFLGWVAMFTAIWYSEKGQFVRLVEYPMSPTLFA